MISVQNLSYTYRGTPKPTLKNLNFEIAKGEIFGFLGPSGAGKSTTQKVLYKILQDFEGEISIEGQPLKKLDKSYLENIGVGFEMPNHYLKLTGKENMELFAAFYPKKRMLPIPELFALVGLEDSMNHPVETYSKGMKMRLNFIRAIMHNPTILFFDEPTAGLDPANAHIIKKHILHLKQEGKTIFITTHNMNTADELCDKVSFIVDGEIRLTEAPSTLKQQYGKHLVEVKLQNGEEQQFPITGLGQNPQFSHFINLAEVASIRTMEASLEEVFLKATGKSLIA